MGLPIKKFDDQEGLQFYLDEDNTPEDVCNFLVARNGGTIDVATKQILELAQADFEGEIDWYALHEKAARFGNTSNVYDISEPLTRERELNEATRREAEMRVEDDVIEVDDKEDEPEYLNDAILLGKHHPDLDAFYDQEMIFMAGNLYGQGDRRNTRDGDWKAARAPVIKFITGDGWPWGLTKHPVAKSKVGASIVPSENIGGQRKDAAIKTMYAIGIDIDSGAVLEDVVDNLVKSGYFASVYSTFNHRKTEMVLKHDEVVRKMSLDDSPNRTQIQEYLRLHHKDRFSRDFISNIEVVESRRHDADGLKIILKTDPIDKFRVIFPLAQPVNLADLAPTMNGYKEKWADAVTGVALNILGAEFDATSCDINRLFFTPRHAEGAEYYSALVQGKPLAFEDIKMSSKTKYVQERKAVGDPFLAGDEGGTHSVPRVDAPSGMNLNDWHRQYKERFEIADVLETYADDKVRVAGGERAGTVHIECPFEHEHSSTGGTATMAMSPDANKDDVWTVFCKHDACQGRHKLEFLGQMLADEWFDEKILLDDGFMIPVPDGTRDDLSPPDNPDDEEILEKIEAAKIGRESSKEQVKSFMKGFINDDLSARQRLAGALGNTTRDKGATAFTPTQINAIWKDLDKEAAQVERDKDLDARIKLRLPDYIPLIDATPESVKIAAAAAKWLPKDWVCSEERREWWFGYVNYEKESKPFVAVCRAFEVVYSADGVKGSSRTNEITIRYKHRSDAMGIVESTFRIGDTYKDSGTILGNLRNEGLDFSPKAKTESILTLLRAIKSKREAVYRPQSGWTKDRKAFASPTGETVKKADDKKLYVLDHIVRVSADKAGTLEEWTNAADLALHGRNVSRFLPGFLGGAVGCLAHFIDTELCVIISNEGKAKHGKTTSLKAGVSWFAVAAADGLLITGDITTTAMETMAGKATGGMYAPDEQGASSMTPEEQQRGSLIHAGGIGRGRGRTDGGMRDTATWHCTLGMSSERSLLSQLEAENADVKAGAMSRIFTVNFDTAHQLDSVKDAAELAAYNVLAHGGAFGWAGIEFAAKLLEMGVDDVKARVSALEAEWGDGHVGAAERVVTTGALFGIAAEIAVEAGLLPDDVDLKTMLKGLLDETLEQRAHHLDTDRQGLDGLRMHIIRAINREQIVDVSLGAESGRGEILGYWMTSDKHPDLNSRTFVLPVDRLGLLGVKTEIGALVDQLREDGGLVSPSAKSKYFKKGLWESTPGEGKRVRSLRVAGSWVYDAEPVDDADA